jgi:SanA protein
MLKRLFKIPWRLILILGLVVLFLPRLITTIYAVDRIYQKESGPVQGIATIFGAGLRRDGTPTPTLRMRDRLITATSLYLNAKVERLLMSGEGQMEGYNGHEAISLDFAGRRTYDTCYRWMCTSANPPRFQAELNP